MPTSVLRSRSQSPPPGKPLAKSSLANNAKAYWSELSKKRVAFEKERTNLSIYTSPLKVMSYFILYAITQIYTLLQVFYKHLGLVAILLSSFLLCYVSLFYDGPHLKLLEVLKTEARFYGYWLLLGIASSIGLGTGLHTFVLFLGPHVAEITMVAYQCGSLDFAVQGANKLLCPPSSTPSVITPAMILLKVLPQSIIWGFGTALGELPPYFISRAAAYAGKSNEELEELDVLSQKEPHRLTYKQKAMLIVYQLLQKTGFMGIFFCASIPNPLFDLAGIMCGHFMIPFTTFFSAVVLGKAFVKASLQVFMIILLFSKKTIKWLLAILKPTIPFLHNMLEQIVNDQIKALKTGVSAAETQSSGGGIIALLWNSLIALMMLYFLFSIIESLAQNYLQQSQQTELIRLEKRQLRHSRSLSVHF